MIDLVTLSGETVVLAAPYFAKMVDGVTEKLGENALDAAGHLIGWLRGRLGPGGRAALNDLAEHPADTVTQDMLKLHIQKELRDKPELIEELRALVASAPRSVQQTQNVSAGSRAAQIAGDHNKVDIT